MRHRHWMIFLLFFFAMGFWALPPKASAEEKPKQAYIYQDEYKDIKGKTQKGETLDSTGRPVKAFEYQALYEEQSKDLQEEAAKPFGKAGAPFGSAWATKKEPPKELKNAGEASTETVIDEGTKTSKDEKSKSAEDGDKVSAKLTSSKKPRVLVA